MSPSDHAFTELLDERLRVFSLNTRRLPGIEGIEQRTAFLHQVVESVHRVKYISLIRRRDIAEERLDPASTIFDPIRAAILYQRADNVDEACWLVFISVHFGKHGRAGWRLAQDVYGSLGGATWTWPRISAAPDQFRQWLRDNTARLKSDGVLRRFGNHRKYQSLDADAPTGTGEAVESYVRWVLANQDHQHLFQNAVDAADGDARQAFDALYSSLTAVATFGRTARFDYLTMLGKLQLADIEPGSPYLDGATGPYNGARLFFGQTETSDVSRSVLNTWITELGDQVGLGMQVLEDSLCNWQKNPHRFVRFRG